MAEKLGFLDQMLWGKWADRAAINRNAEDLSNVEADVTALRTLVQRQAAEITQLRAMFMGMVEVLHQRGSLDETELESAVKAAFLKLSPPPPEPKPSASDPYRGIATSEPTAEAIEAAKALLATAQKHHFGKRFDDARAVYQQIIDQYADTKQAATARQQLENLRKA
ncbi:MAG TPA: hypothetical protein VFV99_02550 [Kofleriaceae bacterium]|nr:hypothetical protein [Kofleriaceae bacterium]